MSRFDASASRGNLTLSGQVSGLDEQNRIPFPSKKGGVPDSPSPRNLDPNPMKDRMMDRMRKVDPKQSERYRQRTGE
jgi:hypothetical protein